MRRWMLRLMLVVLTLGGGVTAQANYEDGQRAWDAGRHSEALREWQAAANAGDAKSMLALGRLYVQGLGVPQNYVHAHMWFSLAASRFKPEAMKERDALAARMAPEQVAKAQELAAAWQPGETQPAASARGKTAGPPPPKAIREAQELLAALGYEPDPPDGQWGERTAQAYQAFVRDANLPMTDTLTPAALKTMRARTRQAGAVATTKPQAALSPDALHRAAKAGNLNGLEAALAAGADVNARDEKGWTALMYVVDKGYVLLVEPLLTAKANVDVRAPDGATALFMAAAHGHSEIISMLMKAGADPTINGPKGKTATEVASTRYGDIWAALRKDDPPAIIALLAGKSLAEGEELVRTWQEKPAGFVFRDCDQCPEMVVVPSGSYQMGSPTFEEGRADDEGPVHPVTIAKPLAVGVYEVTIKEFGRFVEATGSSAGSHCRMPGEYGVWEERSDRHWRYPGFVQTGHSPVVCMSWQDAQAYVRWLSRETSQDYRLLSEAEWEYVARAGSMTRYHWGDDVGTNKANCDGCGSQWDNNGPAPVGSFKPNAFGLFDTSGNVWEWVEDCWHSSYEGAPSDGTAWTSGVCSDRALRGGGWHNSPESLRSANRGSNSGLRDYDNGFRVARTLD